MTAHNQVRPAFAYEIVVVMTFVVMQALVIVMHEFTHSTVVWR